MPSNDSSSGIRRSHVVWACWLLAMSLVGGTLVALEPDRASDDASAPMLLAEVEMGAGEASLADAVRVDETVANDWDWIVVHHSGSVMGSANTIDAQHRDRGFESLGYHFVIGNGQGETDGLIEVGPRWSLQQPGAHTAGPDSERYNRRGIGICLVGDGERRGFTERQFGSLVSLIRALCEEHGIPASNVVLHREVAPTSGPGRYFSETRLRDALAPAF
ncbi:MAG: peptidoglycan recognition family protein [Planctomycetota bacterium]